MTHVFHSTGVLNMFATSGCWNTSSKSYLSPGPQTFSVLRMFRITRSGCERLLGPTEGFCGGGGFSRPSACGFLRMGGKVAGEDGHVGRGEVPL